MGLLANPRVTAKANVPLLVIEDCDQDYAAIARVFFKAGITNPTVRSSTGEEGLDYLYGRGRHAPHPGRPGLIILDQGLPGISGQEVLATVKRDPQLSNIPILIFTSSPKASDVQACYRKGANTYLIKPSDPEEFAAVVDIMRTYWLDKGAMLPNIELI